ncbi:MAG: hypothetical protein NTY21_04365 [Actinobacteria bacterium]|nr:hypothetical protein [Actinomycetota bacterium]
MKSGLVFGLTILFSLWYLTFSATRLDRLHHRVETSWANLDSLLHGRLSRREARIEERSQAESGLSGALGLLQNDLSSGVDSAEQSLLRELENLTEKVRIAIAIHVDAVNSTREVRKKWIFKVFRLAGTAPLPVTYEFEHDVL